MFCIDYSRWIKMSTLPNYNEIVNNFEYFHIISCFIILKKLVKSPHFLLDWRLTRPILSPPRARTKFSPAVRLPLQWQLPRLAYYVIIHVRANVKYSAECRGLVTIHNNVLLRSCVAYYFGNAGFNYFVPPRCDGDPENTFARRPQRTDDDDDDDDGIRLRAGPLFSPFRLLS